MNRTDTPEDGSPVGLRRVGLLTVGNGLQLAASPILLTLALGSYIGSDESARLCGSTHLLPSLNSMASMYLVMGLLHGTAWLRVLSGRGEARDRTEYESR